MAQPFPPILGAAGCDESLLSQILSRLELHELSEELNTNPSPELEEHLTWAGIWPQKMVKVQAGASLVAQWLRICLPTQGTRVRALVWEDPTCRGAAGPVSHNY